MSSSNGRVASSVPVRCVQVEDELDFSAGCFWNDESKHPLVRYRNKISHPLLSKSTKRPVILNKYLMFEQACLACMAVNFEEFLIHVEPKNQSKGRFRLSDCWMSWLVMDRWVLDYW